MNVSIVRPCETQDGRTTREDVVSHRPITGPSSTASRAQLRQLLVKISSRTRGRAAGLMARLYFDRAHLEINRHSFRGAGITIYLHYPHITIGRSLRTVLSLSPYYLCSSLPLCPSSSQRSFVHFLPFILPGIKISAP